MAKRSSPLRKLVRQITTVILGIQVCAGTVLVILDWLRRKKQSFPGYPKTNIVPVEVDQNKLTIYTYGEDLYRSMINHINKAKNSIYFETYIWKNDKVGLAFKKALINAANRGVKVFVIYDAFANLIVSRDFFDFPKIVNVYCHPILSRPWSPKYWGRDHRKLLVVDSLVAFIGGYNVGKNYATRWRDSHLKVIGHATLELERTFIDFWNLHAHKDQLKEKNQTHRSWHSLIAVHCNIPRRQVFPIRNMYLEAIDRAQKNIWLTHAYLIPDMDLTISLINAAQRGVDVRIIVPSRSNHVIADWLSRGYYKSLLAGGVKLFLYQNAMVHAKTATIDSIWSTIGTANLDRLSLVGNYEINVEIINKNFASRMENIFKVDLTNTIELTLDQWNKRSLIAKSTEIILTPWRPFF